jgi:hypothetical protein
VILQVHGLAVQVVVSHDWVVEASAELADLKAVGDDGVIVQISTQGGPEGITMNQPTAEQALKEIEVLVGEWSQTATPAGGEPWPGEAKATFEWLEGGQLLLERSTVEMPEAPDGVCIYGCDAANGTYYQLYTDDRNVCRVYQMSIGKGEWKLWRDGEPFNQRFTATISEDGNRIEGRWEYDEGDGWKTDFDLVYTRVR